MPSAGEVAVVDLLDPAVWRDLNGTLAQARDYGPVALTADGRKLFLRYADVNEGLRHHALSTAALDALLLGNGVDDGPLWDWCHSIMLSMDPPAHTRLRKLTEKAFTRLVNEQYEVLQRGIAIHKRLERLVLEERWLDELVRALAAATGGAVKVLSARGETIAEKLFRREVPEELLAPVREEVRRRSAAARPLWARAQSQASRPTPAHNAKWCTRAGRPGP